MDATLDLLSSFGIQYTCDSLQSHSLNDLVKHLPGPLLDASDDSSTKLLPLLMGGPAPPENWRPNDIDLDLFQDALILEPGPPLGLVSLSALSHL